jgi:hypothetical protein
VIRRLSTATVCGLLTALVLAAPALAHDNGEGLLGETDDKIVTLFSMCVLGFFFLVVVLGTVIQGKLEKRKDAKKAASMRQRVGW